MQPEALFLTFNIVKQSSNTRELSDYLPPIEMKYVVALAQDNCPFIRREIAHYLYYVGDSHATELLAKMLRDEDSFVSENARKALQHIGR